MIPFSIAALQLPLDAADNRDAVERACRIAKRLYPWIDMIVLPELAAFGPSPRSAEPLPGPTEARFQALAAKLGVWLIDGSLFEAAEGKIFNTASAIAPDGRVVARYRKMFPFLPYEEGIAAGRQFVTFDVPEVGRFGISLCYDMWFPETTRALAWEGAEVIVHPSMTPTPDRDREVVIAQASAACNQVYFVDVNAAGVIGTGKSVICGPDGEVIHRSGDGFEIVPVEIDLERVRAARARGSCRTGQMLKSFRDAAIAFPQYAGGRSAALDALGPLVMPRSREGNDGG